MAYCAEHCYDYMCIGGVGPAIEKNKEFYRAAGRMDEYFKGIDETRDRLRKAMIKRNEADERAQKEIEDGRKKGTIRKLEKTKNGFELNGQEISLPPILQSLRFIFMMRIFHIAVQNFKS